VKWPLADVSGAAPSARGASPSARRRSRRRTAGAGGGAPKAGAGSTLWQRDPAECGRPEGIPRRTRLNSADSLACFSLQAQNSAHTKSSRPSVRGIQVPRHAAGPSRCRQDVEGPISARFACEARSAAALSKNRYYFSPSSYSDLHPRASRSADYWCRCLSPLTLLYKCPCQAA
jgi:hypothetical protein